MAHDGICGVSATAQRHGNASAVALPAIAFMLLSRPPAWTHIFNIDGPNVDVDEDVSSGVQAHSRKWALPLAG